MKWRIYLTLILIICAHLGHGQRRVSLFYDSAWALNSKAQASYFRNAWIDTTYFAFLGPVVDYHVDGKLAMKGKYVGGVKSGTFTFYYLNGEIKMEGDFQDNQMVGIWQYYYPDGSHRQSIEFTAQGFKILSYHDRSGTEKIKAGNGLWEGHYYSMQYKDTIHISGAISEGLKDDWWVYYDDSGKKLFEERYKGGEFRKHISYNSLGMQTNKSNDAWQEDIFLPYSIHYTERFLYAPNILQSDYPFLAFLPDDQKLYFNEEWESCAQEMASFYRLVNENNTENSSGSITDYYMNDQVYRQGRYLFGKKDGPFIYYHHNGQIASQGRFVNDKKSGQWQYFYPDGRPRQNIFYEEDQRYVDQYWDEQGNLKVDQGSGEYEEENEYISITLIEKGRFEDYQKVGLWQGFTEDGELYCEEAYEQGKLVRAHSFDAQANKIHYLKKIEPAAPGEGMDPFYQFVGKHLDYPTYARSNQIEGRVLLQFVVDKEGSLLDVKAISSPHKSLSEEAIRVVSKYDSWKAGKEMGKAVKMSFILPLTFQLSGASTSSFN